MNTGSPDSTHCLWIKCTPYSLYAAGKGAGSGVGRYVVLSHNNNRGGDSYNNKKNNWISANMTISGSTA